MFEEKVGLDLREDSDNENEGEYVLESDSQTQNVAQEWTVRVCEQELQGSTLQNFRAATGAVMDVDFLCN